jgi:hypothetical protein
MGASLSSSQSQASKKSQNYTKVYIANLKGFATVRMFYRKIPSFQALRISPIQEIPRPPDFPPNQNGYRAELLCATEGGSVSLEN